MRWLFWRATGATRLARDGCLTANPLLLDVISSSLEPAVIGAAGTPVAAFELNSRRGVR